MARNIWNLMKDKPKQEPIQGAVISGQCRLKCLPLMDQKRSYSGLQALRPEYTSENE